MSGKCGKTKTTKTAKGKGADGAVDKKLDAYHENVDKAQAALLGYARIDIIKRKMLFGKYNPRELNNREKALLLDSFVNNGLDRYAFVNVINIIVNPDRIVEGSVRPYDKLPPVQRDGSHLPWIEFDEDDTDEEATAGDGKYGQTIVAAGGRHRRAALADWIKMKRSALHATEKHARELKARMKNPTDDDEPVTEEMVAKVEADVAYMKGLVNTGGAWVVAVYDESECSASARVGEVRTLTSDEPCSASRRGDRTPSVSERADVHVRGDRGRGRRPDVQGDARGRETVARFQAGGAREHAREQDRTAALPGLRLPTPRDDRRQLVPTLHALRRFQDIHADERPDVSCRRGESIRATVGLLTRRIDSFWWRSCCSWNSGSACVSTR